MECSPSLLNGIINRMTIRLAAIVISCGWVRACGFYMRDREEVQKVGVKRSALGQVAFNRDPPQGALVTPECDRTRPALECHAIVA